MIKTLIENCNFLLHASKFEAISVRVHSFAIAMTLRHRILQRQPIWDRLSSHFRELREIIPILRILNPIWNRFFQRNLTNELLESLTSRNSLPEATLPVDDHLRCFKDLLSLCSIKFVTLAADENFYYFLMDLNCHQATVSLLAT